MTHSCGSSHIGEVGKRIHNPSCVVLVHCCVLQLVPQECQLNGNKSVGEIKEYSPHSAPRLLQVRALCGAGRYQHCPLPCEAVVQTAQGPLTCSPDIKKVQKIDFSFTINLLNLTIPMHKSCAFKLCNKSKIFE